MLILVLILCLATSLYVALRRKDSLSLYLLGMRCVTWSCLRASLSISRPSAAQQLTAGVPVSGSKAAGVAPCFQSYGDRLGYVVAVGRSLFPPVCPTGRTWRPP